MTLSANLPRPIKTRLFKSPFVRALAVAACLGAVTGPAIAQNLFAPVARVNDSVVTEYEVQQRQRFLQLLNAPDATREKVIEALIDDRLRSKATSEVGIEVTPEGMRDAMADFASRANLTADEFITALAQNGVERETFRDFVENTVTWRELIRARYVRNVSITEGDIDARLGKSSAGSSIRVLVSEIIIPAPPQNAARVNALAERIAQSTSANEFSSYARKYSATASRGAGGRLPWQNVEDLPPSLQGLILGLAPGEVTAPLSIPNAVALFQLRDIQETGKPARKYSSIDYAAYYIAGGRSEAGLAAAASLRGRVDTCDDLYGVAKGQPKEVLDRETKAPGDIPRDFAIELSKLDAGESSTALTRNNGETLVFLMMCKRVAETNSEVDRETVRGTLRQEQLQGYSNQLINQLRADARISRK
jgi:peptidyl-prolyl cis-trans isomerase SurA